MEYKIEGESFPVVICELKKGETMLCEGGAMSWMSDNMVMETSSNGGISKMLGRAWSGEKMFFNRYTAQKDDGMIAFSSCFPGTLKPFSISQGHEIIVQKSSYLCSTDNIDLSVYFHQKISTSLFGGEGFIMQKISGDGLAFMEFDGYIKEYTLAKKQKLIVSTSNLAGMDGTCSMTVEAVPGMKNKFFGGEGMFNTTIEGPGRVWVQSMPITELAQTINSYLPAQTSNNDNSYFSKRR